MSKVCQVTGKKGSTGHNRSHALNATKRTFGVNLFKKKVLNPLTGKKEKMVVSAKGLKKLTKKLR